MAYARPGRIRFDLGFDVWLLISLNFLASFAYHMMAVLLVVYATDEFGLTDVDAGMLYGWWGVISACWSTVFGFFFIDRLGVKRMTMFGTVVMVATRLVLVVTRSPTMLRTTVLLFSPIAEGVLTPVYMVGIKKLTDEDVRPMAFSINYAMGNAGGALSDVLIDVLRNWMPRGARITPARACFMLSVVALCVTTVLACALPQSLSPSVVKHKYEPIRDEEDDPAVDAQDSSKHRSGSLLRDRNLWRVCAVATCLVFTKTQWHHMNATMPKYLIRELGEDVPWGSVNSINYWVCAALPPFLAQYMTGWKDFPTILMGSFVMAVAPVWMVFSTSIAATSLWLLTMSLGEVVWSPRFTTYTANLSTPGREGKFLVLAYLPGFLATLPTGWLSGLLLDSYCPDCPQCRDPKNGAFCRMSCTEPGAPELCSNFTAAGRSLISSHHKPALQCTSRQGSSSCLSRHWDTLTACPTGCAACPGWRAPGAQGNMLWFWVLLVSATGPLMLLAFRNLLQAPATRSPTIASAADEMELEENAHREGVVPQTNGSAGHRRGVGWNSRRHNTEKMHDV